MMTFDAIEAKATQLVSSRVRNYQDALAFVTDKVAFNMRNVIKLARKNYWGVFDEQVDPVTGRKKIFVPLTQHIVETVVKNIDLDTKDVNFRAKNQAAVPYATLVRAVVKNALDEMHFGEKLDIFERALAMDGTAVWKTWTEVDEEGEEEVCTKLVDLLNCYIDPQAESIQKSDFIERAVLTREEIEEYTDWINTDKINYREHIHPTDENMTNFANKSQSAEIFEFWGTITKDLMTGNPKDGKKQLQGHIVCSRAGSAWNVHLIEENKEKKPYEEGWAIKVPGRWYGRGMAETVMQLQIWMNQVVNMRINKAQVAQLGIFKIKTGSGITPQMISRMASNGVIPVQSMDDIQQLVMEDVKSSSYSDEQVIFNWAQRATSTYEAATGESLPASTPATNSAIQNQAVQSAFVLMKENLGFFIERWIKHSLYPMIQKSLTANKVVRITGDLEDLQKFDEMVVNHQIYEEIERVKGMGYEVNKEQVLKEKERLLAKQKMNGKTRFMTIMEDIDPFEYDVSAVITNENIDPTVVTRNLLSMLQFVPEYKDQVVKQIFDLMGLDFRQEKQALPPTGQQMQQMPGMAGAGNPADQRLPAMNAQAQLQEANQV
jgi:hypothetical protein